MDGKCKVLFFLPVYKKNPRTGGEIYNTKLINGLKERGVCLEVLTLDEVQKGKIYHKLKSYDGKISLLIYDTWLYRYLWSILPLIRFSCSYKLASFSQLCYWDNYKSFHSRSIHFLSTLLTILPAHLNIGVSQTVLKRDLGPFSNYKKKKVVYPGCLWAKKDFDLADCNASPLRIISVGNYTPRKGFHILVQAMGIIAKNNPDLLPHLRLHLVGNRSFSADYVKHLEDLIAKSNLDEYVFLDDWKTTEEISKLYTKSQLFAFASFSEGFGMVVLEAMLHGLPVLLGDFQVAPELLGPNPKAGSIVPGNSPKTFASEIIRYLQKKDKNELGQSSRQRGLEMAFSWEDVVSRFENIIK